MLSVLLGLQTLYVISANVVLAYFLTGWLATPELKVTYTSASSWLPGRVNIQDLSIRSHDYNIQFQLDIADATLWVALHRLPFREFSGDEVDAKGVRFKVRHNVEALEPAQRRIEAFPSIEGYPEPPVYRSPPPDPVPESEDQRFTIHLTDIQADVRELWFLEVRYQGVAHAAGGFRLQPGRALRLDPATLNLQGGALTLGDHTIAQSTVLHATAEIDAPDLQNLPGRKILSKISASVDSTLTGGDLSFLNVYLPLDRQASLSGDWKMVTDVAVQSGVLQANGSAQITAERAQLRMAKPASDFTSRLSAQFIVDDAADAELSAHLQDVTSADDGPSIDRAEAILQLGGADLSGELSPHLRKLIIERLEAPRLSWFEALLKDPAPKLAGSATFDLNWQDPNPSEATGEAKLTLKADTIRAKDTAFSGDVSMNVALGRDKESVTLSPLELELSNATFSTEDNRSDRFAARIVSNSSRFMSKREPVAFQGTFDIHVRPAEALLPVLMADAPATLSQVLLALDALHARLAVFIASDLTRVELLQSASGAIQAEGAWQETSSSSKGAFLLNTWLVNLGVSLKDGESSFELGADQKFLKKSP